MPQELSPPPPQVIADGRAFRHFHEGAARSALEVEHLVGRFLQGRVFVFRRGKGGQGSQRVIQTFVFDAAARLSTGLHAAGFVHCRCVGR